MMNIIVGCLVIDDDKLLLVREKGKLGFPVGHLEDNESITEGALREVFEESGYNVKLRGVLPIVETINDKGRYVLIRFVGDVLSYQDITLDGISDVVWMKIDDALNLDEDEFRFKENKDILNRFINNEIYPLNIVSSLNRSEVGCSE
jgi:ADP-ribose pyrophosphatase YjhB (NUDIX family)